MGQAENQHKKDKLKPPDELQFLLCVPLSAIIIVYSFIFLASQFRDRIVAPSVPSTAPAFMHTLSFTSEKLALQRERKRS